MMMEMGNGDISEPFATENGYYVVRMINNDNPETYETMVKNAIEDAENTAFETYYGESILTKHDVKINERAIKNVKMGSFATAY